MTIEFILPELGENVTKGDVVSVFVAAGDTIQLDQPILEIETDKAVIEVPSNVSGVIKQVLVKEGDTVKPGQLILTIAAAGGSAVMPKPLAVEAPPAPAPVESPPPPPPLPARPADAETQEVVFELPELGENVLSGTIVSIFAAVGDQIAPDQPLLEIETDKAVIEVPATRAGQVTAVLVSAGDKVSPGQAVLKFLTASAAQPVTTPLPAQSAPVATPERPAPPAAVAPVAPVAPISAPPSQRPPQEVEASPSVRRLAREIGVDVTEVPGSGPGGRILMPDVKEFSRQKHLAQPAEAPVVRAVAEGRPLPDFTRWGAIEAEPMSNVRRVTAEHLSHAWQAPHVTQFDKADITEVEAFRKKYAKLAEAAGGKLTITVILLKVLAAALKKFPQFNASVDMAQQQVIYKKYYHLGVAIDTPRGLLVPVIRNVDQKNIIQLAAELAQISERARNRKTGPDELQGGTFTISNLGGIGGTAFTPVVNWPEVAILGVSRGGFEPVYNAQTGQFEPRLMLPLSLSYDHRLIDGADGARFIRWLVEVLENPFLLSLEG